jgi:undecaprenyl-diphosphatase
VTTFQGIILGFIQGLTEFLPVSSSGHLALMRAVIGGDVLTNMPLVFDVAVHVATLFAVIVYFHREVLSLVSGGVVTLLSVSPKYRPQPSSRAAADRKLFLHVVIASVPTAIIGLLIRHYLESGPGQAVPLLERPFPVGLMLIVTGLFLYATRKYRDPGREFNLLNPLDAAVVGVVQGLAVLPGLSRSGSTISTGIIIGLERKVAARFSFLIAVPAIVGASILELPKLFGKGAEGMLGPTLTGAVVAFATGYAAIFALMHVLERRRFAYFAPYCWVVGILAVILGLLRG